MFDLFAGNFVGRSDNSRIDIKSKSVEYRSESQKYFKSNEWVKNRLKRKNYIDVAVFNLEMREIGNRLMIHEHLIPYGPYDITFHK